MNSTLALTVLACTASAITWHLLRHSNTSQLMASSWQFPLLIALAFVLGICLTSILSSYQP